MVVSGVDTLAAALICLESEAVRTNFMEESPSENISSAGEELHRVLWNPKVHYRLGKDSFARPYLEAGQSVAHRHSVP